MLTSGVKMQIRMYLGWSERFRQTDSRLEQALLALDQSQSVDAENYIIGLLSDLATLDTSLTDAHKRLKALKVGSIDLPGNKEIVALRSEGRRLAGRIASLLGVEIRHDVFSGAGPSSYATWGGLRSGGNLPEL